MAWPRKDAIWMLKKAKHVCLVNAHGALFEPDSGLCIPRGLALARRFRKRPVYCNSHGHGLNFINRH